MPLLNQHGMPAVSSTRNLGVGCFGDTFNFREHISQMCRTYYYHIRDLRRIRRYLSLSIAKTIATALVTCRLNYCNSLLRVSQNYNVLTIAEQWL